MYEIISRLRQIATSLNPSTCLNSQVVDKIKSTMKDVDKSWSQSWLGYHSNVYYKDLQPPHQVRTSAKSGACLTTTLFDIQQVNG